VDIIEVWVGRIGGAVGVLALGVALAGIWRARKQRRGRETGRADRMLRIPTYLLIGIPYFLFCCFLWKPFPIALTLPMRAIALSIGSLLYFPGLILYLWSWATLGRFYNVSSSLGVRLSEDHKLISDGPYGFVRHPMYLGIQVAAIGGIFLYRNWTFVFLFVNFLFLIFRAQREEEALALEFGEQWEAYRRRIPAWIPRLGRIVP